MLILFKKFTSVTLKPLIRQCGPRRDSPTCIRKFCQAKRILNLKQELVWLILKKANVPHTMTIQQFIQ